MSYWIVRQSLTPIDIEKLASEAEAVCDEVEKVVAELYRTTCTNCGNDATVKYFLWVKQSQCPHCKTMNDLFPGYLLAEAERHPKHVVACHKCGALNEYDRQPTLANPARCRDCRRKVFVEGPAKRQRVTCRTCEEVFPYVQPKLFPEPPRHRLWAIEYHCADCKPDHSGRFFKKPDTKDHSRFSQAKELLAQSSDLMIPDNTIPPGDETARLHRWGYKRYREMFNDRQLLGLGLLLRRICEVREKEIRYALLTVFSDSLRYQNMLCRYDTYALKCQDIFSVHGFPVGLVQCENNLLGIPDVGSGSFRHFIKKYIRAKRYCDDPFETQTNGRGKKIVPVRGEYIGACLVNDYPTDSGRQAWLRAAPATELTLRDSLDGVFTDPPYFDNVQYAELIDFCFTWLRLALHKEFEQFSLESTRASNELTGNVTLGRGLEHFTAGLSSVFCHYAGALKTHAPFVFTYHHNDASAYVPLIVAILDADLDCTATLPAVAEMSASLHIAGTGSSVLDSVFVCRKQTVATSTVQEVAVQFGLDVQAMSAAGVSVTEGDRRCLLAGHIARLTINRLHAAWDARAPLQTRMALAEQLLSHLTKELDAESLVTSPVSEKPKPSRRKAIAATV